VTKKIEQLVPDIYGLLVGKTTPLAVCEPDLTGAWAAQLRTREAPTREGPLYASEYGEACPRKLWYKRNKPELGEPLEPYVKFKFMYGDAIEELALCLAMEAGHEVSHCQERCVLENSEGKELLSGRIDAVIDGHMVDVKSMSTFAFNKYKDEGCIRESNDSFGYRWQIAFYHHLGIERGWIKEDAEPYFLGIDKQLGHMQLIPVHDLPTKSDVAKRAARSKAIVLSDDLPDRGYTDQPEGASGNMKLGIACSYCAFKNECWPGLRTFLYSRGPTFLTHVVKEPKVPEVHHGG
jgi:hypothetical protein